MFNYAVQGATCLWSWQTSFVIIMDLKTVGISISASIISIFQPQGYDVVKYWGGIKD